jgi:GNAT superfamily N-acetyltransferase
MDANLRYRLATENDLPEIVRMLVDDALGTTREKIGDTVPDSYLSAFRKIEADPNQELTMVEMNGEIVASFQLTFIQYLTYQGGLRAQMEAVRTRSDHRGKGIGTKVFEYAIQRARERGCHLLQLTTDKKRPDAIRFYESLGFIASHEGMKLKIG